MDILVILNTYKIIVFYLITGFYRSNYHFTKVHYFAIQVCVLTILTLKASKPMP